MVRVFWAGIVAGMVVFAWGAFSHMVLPLGTIGIHSLPDEEAITSAFRHGIARPGFYFFPGVADLRGAGKDERAAAMRAYAEKARRGPTGILVIQPGGQEMMTPRLFGAELLANLLSGLIAALLVSMAGAGLASLVARVMFVTLLGLFATLAIEVSYWIWYSFPTSYTLAQLLDQVSSWFFGGLALGVMLKPKGRSGR